MGADNPKNFKMKYATVARQDYMTEQSYVYCAFWSEKPVNRCQGEHFSPNQEAAGGQDRLEAESAPLWLSLRPRFHTPCLAPAWPPSASLPRGHALATLGGHICRVRLPGQ